MTTAACADWQQQLIHHIRTQRSHCFLLHGNTEDEVQWGETRDTRPEEWLEKLGRQHDYVLRYNVAQGVTFIQGREADIPGLLAQTAPKKSTKQQALEEELERAASSTPATVLDRDPEKLCRQLTTLLGQKNHRIFLIVEYAESLWPSSEYHGKNKDTVAIFARIWARDERMREAGHIIIGITRHVDTVHASVRDSMTGMTVIRIPKPTEHQRAALFHELQCEGDQRALLHISAGLALRQIRTIIKGCRGSDIADAILREKIHLLENEYGDLFEFCRPEFGFEAIGGQGKVIARLMQVAGFLSKGIRRVVPQGILLTGPPRTSKTVLAKALAKEAGIACAMLRNMKSSLVGSTEQRLERLADALRDLTPLIVIVDEVDVRFGTRSGYQGDGGTSQRELGKILEITADTSLQGGILWMFICNRPDNLDPAFRQPGRMDDRIPVLPPCTDEARIEVFHAVLRQIQGVAEDSVEWNTLVQRLDDGVTGGDIRAITQMALRYAMERGGDCISHDDYIRAIDAYIPPRQDGDIAEMTRMAIAESSSAEFLPEEIAAKIRQSRGAYATSPAANQPKAPERSLEIDLETDERNREIKQ